MIPHMSNPLKMNTRTLPDHLSADGETIATELRITLHASGALSVSGPIDNLEWALAVLENARDAVMGYHSRKAALMIPAKDVRIPL